MTAQDYLGVLRRGWLTILATTLAGIAIAGLLALVTPAKYASTVTFYISTQGTTASSTDAYQGSLLSQERVKSYTQLLSSYRLGDEIVRDLGLAADPQEVAGEVSATISPDTVLLTATVTDRSPQRAQDIASAMGRAFPTLVAALEKPANSALPPAVTAQVVQGPLPSEGAVAPEPVVYVLAGAIAGLLLGVAIVVLRRSLDRRVRSLDTLRRIFPAPLLGGLAEDPAVQAKPIFLRDRPRAPISEHMRTVRTNFELFNFDDAARCHVVTSAVENEGKSTVLCNLAIAEADAGRRVLVIEADLRKPAASGYLGLPNQVGLTQVLGGKLTLEESIQSGPSPRLSVLASGPLPPNPYEMLQSEQMTALLARARALYDTVLIDAPPLLPVADGLELARSADSVVCVVRARFAPATSITRAYDLLTSAGITHVGTVFNAVSSEDDGAYGSSYYAYGETGTATRPTDPSKPSGPAALPAPARSGAGPEVAVPTQTRGQERGTERGSERGQERTGSRSRPHGQTPARNDESARTATGPQEPRLARVTLQQLVARPQTSSGGWFDTPTATLAVNTDRPSGRHVRVNGHRPTNGHVRVLGGEGA